MKKRLLLAAAAIGFGIGPAPTAEAGPVRRFIDRRRGGETQIERRVERNVTATRVGNFARGRLCTRGGCN
jgi:hypothetical protein